ncbi:MAG: hypothetical protein GX593_00840 [Actinomycetales bacterium]|nr:hypothetical protein [Actinomycetales bacterium]
MTTTPESAAVSHVPAEPPSPVGTLVWALAWASIAALGFVVLSLEWQRTVSSGLAGQRSEGIVLITPILATVAAVLLVGRAIWAVGARRRHRERWTAEQTATARRRRLAAEPWVPLVAIGAAVFVVWLAGTVAVLVALPTMRERPAGLSLALMLLGLVGMGWVVLLLAGARRRSARRTR